MIVRIELTRNGLENSLSARNTSRSRWVQAVLLLVGCLALGYSAFVYIETALYQASEGMRFDRAVSAAAPKTAVRARMRLMPPAPLALAVQKGSPFSRIEIPRLGISAVVVEGVGARELKLAVGHIPGTALPWETGNIGIAGHRDTFFRKLGGVRTGDTITLTTLVGSYRYSVDATEVVGPASVEVLKPSSDPVLTLVTCYPFYYVGPAPDRFVVRARRTD